jgi:hypothetical protein
MIFRFVVRHLRWLARVPVAPHIFDALLLTWTAIFHRERFAAMMALEAEALRLPGVSPCRHRFGGIGFVGGECEFAHLHGNGLMDVLVTREIAEDLMAARLAEPHHVFGPSSWVSFWIRRRADVPNAVALLRAGLQQLRHSPPELAAAGRYLESREV